ncbi:hypothetical protein LARV_03709 [Longilinea arvoryzae]|uniref:HEAT repeat domain-containing protein n=1 Tax=Longilinea arvoryzae TaxID=360412 RepID=A0A0K8MXE3_9CHLR|nr:hypothetical protein [Longilinea arvoryzae]GAP15914.1 hypothetical protein LARV_03709 [Longilinea arvoryzae]
MSSKIDLYRSALRECPDWPGYLCANSHLPGPRGNLELAEAVFQEASREMILSLIARDSTEVEENSPQVFGVFCGVFGLGRLLAGGELDWMPKLREYASDRRWRVREAVAWALQKYGAADMPGLLAQMRPWAAGTFLEQRAVAVALCEPSLLNDPAAVREVLQILDGITVSLSRAVERKTDDFRALRQTLGYGWSVAAVASWADGKAFLERWFECADPDVRWLMRENLKKKRLERADSDWVQKWRIDLDR